MEKGQIVYIINNNDIEPAEFIEITSGVNVCVKKLNNDISCVGIWSVYDTEEEAYKKLLDWLENDKQEAEEGIENLKEELDVINEAIRKLKQKYEI